MGQAPAYDLHPQAQRGGGPAHQPALVGGIGPEQPDAAEAHAQRPQRCAGGVAVLDAGGGDQYDQQQPRVSTATWRLRPLIFLAAS